MGLLDLSSPEARYRTIYKIVAIVSGSVLLGLTLFTILVSYFWGINVVGESLVNLPSRAPFEFPQPEYFPIYAKPVTWLYVSIIAFWFSFMELNRDRIAAYSPAVLTSGKLFFVIIASLSAYEVFYNFSIWSALMAYQAIRGALNPDLVVVAFPNPNTPWNLVFATKFFSAVFVISLYSLYFLLKLRPAR
jgi:hypothetical protein